MNHLTHKEVARFWGLKAKRLWNTWQFWQHRWNLSLKHLPPSFSSTYMHSRGPSGDSANLQAELSGFVFLNCSLFALYIQPLHKQVSSQSPETNNRIIKPRWITAHKGMTNDEVLEPGQSRSWAVTGQQTFILLKC